MNKPIFMATITLATLIGAGFAVPAIQLVNAQGYGGGAQPDGIEQQLKLAREKVSNAKGESSAMIVYNIKPTCCLLKGPVIIWVVLLINFNSYSGIQTA